MARAGSKEINIIIRAIHKAGGEVKVGGSGHWKVYRDNRLVTVISNSTVSNNARHHILADLKRGGLPVVLT